MFNTDEFADKVLANSIRLVVYQTVIQILKDGTKNEIGNSIDEVDIPIDFSKGKSKRHKINKTRLHYAVDNEDLFLRIVNDGYASELRGNNDIDGKKIYFFNKLDEIKKIIDDFYNDMGKDVEEKTNAFNSL